MLPNSEDSTLIKIIKIFAIYIFPTLIVGLLVAILFVPAPKKQKEPKTAQEIEEQIQKLEAQKNTLSGK